MKKLTQKTLFLLALLLVMCTANFNAQTITGTVITQPCNNNGQIGVTVSGLTPPITYIYSGGLSGQSFTHSNVSTTSDNLTGIGAYYSPWGNANVWSIKASDLSGSAAITLTLNPAFTIDSINVIPANCPAMSTVQAVNFIGGTSPFSCLWTNQTTSQNYSGNPATVSNGPYVLTVTDGVGCIVSTPSFSGGIYVWSNSNININMTGTSANCTNGTATATATGGTSPYTYLWNNNAASQSISGLSQGQFWCTATDAIGCQSTGYYYVQQAVTINYNQTITNATCLQNNGAITSFVNGGTAPYTYLWSNTATTANLTGLTGGQSYQVVVTDANGCTAINSVYVGVTTPIAVNYNTSPSSCTASTGAATLIATGGATPYSFLWYTFPSNTTGSTISSKPSGFYSFQVTDANGCVQTGQAYIPPVSAINAVLNSANIVCPATSGTITTSVSSPNPPYTYLWSNSATTSGISSVPLGSYNCTITNAVGCSVVKNALVAQSSPINVGLSSTPVTCMYSANGSMTASATGGTGPYTYTWSNSQTGATATSLLPGTYYVYVTDANGCHDHNHGNVGNSMSSNACYCTITGTVYNDANNNCVQNSGENGVQNIQIHCSGIGYAYTNSNGVYSFMAPSGTYTITESVQQIYPLASCQSNNQVVTVTAAANCVSTVNFANNTVPISDLRIITSNVNWPIPGNTYNQKVIVQNDGTLTESTIKIGYTHDGQLSYSSCTPWALTQQNSTTYPNWYSITSGFTTLNPGAGSTNYVSYNVPTNIPLNTAVVFNDTVAKSAPISTSWLTDNTPWNNVDNHTAYVIGSFDPNFKEVSPQGIGSQGNILVKDSILTYIVHFQNTGSYYAQNIVVVDTLDSDLSVTTLRPGYSDHTYTTSINETGVVKFTFPNIHLPWKSQYGDVLSSGMVTYSVKLKKNLALGTQIKNRAAIYFDYNDPIITNTTLNTLSAGPVSVTEIRGIDRNGALLFPNPANNYFTLAVTSAKNEDGMLSVFDISGREVSSKIVVLQTGENNLVENTSNLESGIYFVQLKSASTVVGKKLIIEK
jgi:hypothetical protein